MGEGFWNGVYADGLYDTSNHRVRASTGVELGYLFLGVDGGPVFEMGEAPVHAGLQIRPMLSLGPVHGKEPQDNFREIGVLLKVPFQVVDARHTGGGRRQPQRIAASSSWAE